MAIDTQIFTTIDFDKEGKQMGTLDVPQSTNTSGWRTQYIPITVVKNGSGPTAILFGGNHGDEFEGPVALLKLARALQPEQIQGRVIILPYLNRPAIEVGTRLSPLDGKNMNRSFPGERNGTITSIIAHYVTNALFPLADYVVDIHSGGRSAHILASVNMHHVPDETQMQGMLDAGIAWGAPYVFIYRDVGGEGLLPGLAEKLGKVTLGTEIGSASQFSAEMVSIAETGVANVLRHWEILEGDLVKPASTPEIVGATELEDYVMAPVSGIFEPLCEMGDELQAGQPLGQIHSIEEPFRAPLLVPALTDGMLMSRRAFPLVRQGDCVATLVRPFSL